MGWVVVRMADVVPYHRWSCVAMDLPRAFESRDDCVRTVKRDEKDESVLKEFAEPDQKRVSDVLRRVIPQGVVIGSPLGSDKLVDAFVNRSGVKGHEHDGAEQHSSPSCQSKMCTQHSNWIEIAIL